MGTLDFVCLNLEFESDWLDPLGAQWTALIVNSPPFFAIRAFYVVCTVEFGIESDDDPSANQGLTVMSKLSETSVFRRILGVSFCETHTSPTRSLKILGYPIILSGQLE